MYCETSNQEKISLGFGGHECNNGTHFCGFYQTVEERDRIIMGYLRQGLVDKARVLYTPTERSREDFLQAFTSLFPSEAALLNDPSFTINTADDLYYSGGGFSPDQMMVNLGNFYADSQKDGKKNIRTTAEMVWALDKNLDKQQLMTYESKLNYFIPGKPWVSICLYNVTRFDGKTIMQVLQTHPYIINLDGTIMKNPFFIHPDTWLAENDPSKHKK